MTRTLLRPGFTKQSFFSTAKTSNDYNSRINISFKKPFENHASFKFPLLFSRGLEYHWKNRIAFTDYTGESFTFGELAQKSAYLAKELKSLVPETEERVAFLCERDFSFLTTLGATWWSQQIAIPLSSAHPDNMLEYFLKSTSTKLVVTNKNHSDRLNKLAKIVGCKLLVVDYESLSNEKCNSDSISVESACLSPSFLKTFDSSNYENKGAVILFTSGTTGKPKGVLLTHGNLQAQVENICGAWGISEDDTMLHVLPLHHTHGLIHALLSPLAGGARCQMLENFDAAHTWQQILSVQPTRPTLFTAVPTVFVKLIEEYDRAFANDPSMVSVVKQTCRDKMRIFLSGSASLPVPILEKFERLSGHRILERYGMTETGLILCNPLHGERQPGFVGTPLKTVKIAVAELEESEKVTILAEADAKGIMLVKENENVDKDGKVSETYW